MSCLSMYCSPQPCPKHPPREIPYQLNQHPNPTSISLVFVYSKLGVIITQSPLSPQVSRLVLLVCKNNWVNGCFLLGDLFPWSLKCSVLQTGPCPTMEVGPTMEVDIASSMVLLRLICKGSYGWVNIM